MAVKTSMKSLAGDLVKTTKRKPRPTVKNRVTIMLSSQTISALERCVMNMKDANNKKRGQINKSLVVELAVTAAITEYNKIGKASQIYINTHNHINANNE